MSSLPLAPPGSQSDSAIHVHVSILSPTPLPSRLPRNIEQSSLCYTVDPWLSILFLAAQALHCCVWAFTSCSEWGLLSSCSTRASHCSGFSCCRARAPGCEGISSCSLWALECALSGCGTWAQLPHSMWNLPGSGIEHMSPALTGGFLTTGLPGKPWLSTLTIAVCSC